MKYIKSFNEHNIEIGSELKSIQSYDNTPALPGFTTIQPNLHYLLTFLYNL